MRAPTTAEIRRSLRGPLVPWRVKGCAHILLGDVRRGSSARIVSVLAMALEHGRIS
jgi:hypothetical protein